MNYIQILIIRVFICIAENLLVVMQRRNMLKSVAGMISISSVGVVAGDKVEASSTVSDSIVVDNEDEGPNIEIVWDTEEDSIDIDVTARLPSGACVAFTQSAIYANLSGKSGGSWTDIATVVAQAGCAINENTKSDEIDLSSSYDQIRIEGDHELLMAPWQSGGSTWIPQSSTTDYLNADDNSGAVCPPRPCLTETE